MTSPKLKAAMAEVRAALKKHDLMGAVFLSDGLGVVEYRMHYTEATWSMFRFIFDEKTGAMKGGHIKMHMKSQPEKTGRTVNALIGFRYVMAAVWRELDSIVGSIRNHADIEESGGDFMPSDDD